MKTSAASSGVARSEHGAMLRTLPAVLSRLSSTSPILHVSRSFTSFSS